MEVSIILAILALVTSCCTGFFQIGSKLRKSDCVNCSYELAGPDEAVLQALEHQNDVILEQMRQRNSYSKSS